MFFRHSYDKLIYPLLILTVFVLISYRPAYHLRPDMPSGFFAADGPCGPKRPVEQKIACAYWDSAQMNIQFKYPHAHPLPMDVPPEFIVDAPALGPAVSSPATRELYWHRLQQVWYLPETWKETYEWNLTWASDPLDAAGQWLRDSIGKAFSVR
jgi:hypothetical protein